MMIINVFVGVTFTLFAFPSCGIFCLVDFNVIIMIAFSSDLYCEHVMLQSACFVSFISMSCN